MRADLSPDTDLQLMQAFQGGDEAAFDQLFQRYKDRVVNFAYRYTGRREVAEELAQEIFVKCYLAAAEYEPRAKFTTWLYRIARNHCLNEVRRQDYRNPAAALTGSEPGDPSQTPEHLARARALEAAVQQALAALPESQRVALLLSRQEGMSYEEIAGALQTSVSAVKSLLNRAKTALTGQLAPHLEDGHEL